ncbi:caspase domain-containing protein [Streptomyces sp. NPDC099088]|uniref:caspase family protein n=1 Tax=Streptomyces sp. NPDC099088 TaxID=3366101 RepID=UPI00380A9022
MYRALLVCNSVYPLEPVELPRLLGPVRDGLAMWSALTDTEIGLFRSEDVEVLFECDKDEILRAANRFFVRCDPDDVLLFYYSGHGKRSKSNLHLCARDTTVELLLASSVSGQELSGYMESSPAQSVIVILDCCHAGAFKGVPPALSPEPLAGKGRFVVTASGATQQAVDASQASCPSPFTQALVEGLRHAEPRSAEGDMLLVDDLYDYALRALAEGVPQPQRRVRGAGDAIIAKRPPRPVTNRQDGVVEGRPKDEDRGLSEVVGLRVSLSTWFKGRGFAGHTEADMSLGDRLPWRVFLLASGLVGLFSYIAWDAWLDSFAYGYSEYSPGVELFFQCCGFLAALCAVAGIAEAVAGDTSWLRRGARRIRFGTGLAFGGMWLASVVSVGLNSSEQALLQCSIAFVFLAAVLERAHDSLYLAGTLLSFAGVFVPADNLGYDGFDLTVLFQALITVVMMTCWYFGATDRQFAIVASLNMVPVAVTFLVHGTVPGVSLYGTAMALLSAVLGDGTRPAEGSASLGYRALTAASGALGRPTPVRTRR